MTHNDLRFLDIAQTRRSLRRYEQHSVPRSLIDYVLTAAIWAPSAHNRQPWRFTVVTSGEVKEALAAAMGARLRSDMEVDFVPEDVIARDVERSYARMTQAPVLFVLCLSMKDMDVYADADRNQNEYVMAVQSTAMAGQNLLLAAHDAGLGACWMCAPLFCADVVRDVLNLPDNWQHNPNQPLP